MEALVDWGFVWDILPLLLRATLVTIEATLIGFGMAASLGLLLAIGRMSRQPWIAWPIAGFVEFIRSTPLLEQLFFMFFVLPKFGIVMPAFLTGILGIGLHYSSYCAAVYRSGLENVPRGQWEAALALNLSLPRTYWDIVIPQAIPPVIPALGNYLVSLFKETPLLSAIAVLELMQTAKILGSEYFRYLEPITLVGLFFLGLSLLSAAAIRRIEHWLATRRG
jgi:polar amino acid transport system permease protein